MFETDFGNHSASLKYDLAPITTINAMKNLSENKAKLLVISGKAGAGKDSVAPLLMDELGFPNAVHEFFAKPLKVEINKIIKIIQNSLEFEEAVKIISNEMNVDVEQSFVGVQLLWNAVKTGKVVDSYNRTPETRDIAQFWGTQVRRNQNEDYWVKPAIKSIVDNISNKISVYLTDVRFPNEADSSNYIGGTIIRLDVSPEVQKERLMKRDGIMLNKKELNHPSEIALDNYKFPIRINTDDLTIDEVVQSILNKI